MKKQEKNKKMLCLLCCSLLAVTLAGCGQAEGAQKQEEQQGTQQESQQPAEEAEQGSQPETGPQGQEEQPETAQQDQENQPEQDLQQPTEGMEQDGESQAAEEDAQAGESASIRIWGPILRVEEDSLVIDNRSDVSYRGEMILAVDGENTRILDAENGYPVEVSELGEGEAVFAYIGSAAALSEPPMVSASMILCKLPDNLLVPDYVQVSAMEEQTDGSYLLSGDNEIQYLVPEDCEILPYLTRNIVTLQDVQAGSGCLIWSDERRTAQKIVLFAD